MKTREATIEDVIGSIRYGGSLLYGRAKVCVEKIEWSIDHQYWRVTADDGEHIALKSLRIEK